MDFSSFLTPSFDLVGDIHQFIIDVMSSLGDTWYQFSQWLLQPGRQSCLLLTSIYQDWLGGSDILAIITAWWVTFTIVMTIVMSLGFGPSGIVAGKSMVPQVYSLMLRIHRLDCSHISIFHVRRIYAGCWSLRYIDKHGNAGHCHDAICDIRFSNCDCGIDSCMETRSWTMTLFEF